jgi:hypothetical protein
LARLVAGRRGSRRDPVRGSGSGAPRREGPDATTHDPPDPSRGPPSLRSTRVVLDRLSAAEREALAPQLHGLYLRYYRGWDLAEFTRFLLSHEGVVVGLFHEGDELVGCTICRCMSVDLDDEVVGVFTAAVYFRDDQRGGFAAGAWGLMEALRHKARRPWRRFDYLSMAHTPAPFVLFTRGLSRIYPSPGCGEPPPRDAEIMRRALAPRQWPAGRGSRWTLRSPFVPVSDAWLRNSRLADSPITEWFLEACPDWAEGDALAVWMPLDVRDIVAGLWRTLR